MTNAPPVIPHIDPTIFTSLQTKIDEEGTIRDELRNIVDNLSKQSRLTQSILSRIHNTPTASLQVAVLEPAVASINEQATTVKSLSEVASKYPFYKWNSIWQREIQTLISSIQICEWLNEGKLVTLEEVGQRLNGILITQSLTYIYWCNIAPVNIKSSDTFHITIEDYLLALTSTIEELSRLAPNSVTLGDYARPVQISRFIKDVHAGFQLLNLKNDVLRRRSDGIKYAVKKVEDVVYDLSLRGLIPKDN
jgi:predicted translin family RNA/ssDNA-binding protein